MTFTLPELGFAYDALEPHIDAKTMEIHHTKHHAAYIAKANAALEGTEWDGKCAGEILSRIKELPDTIRTAVQNNLGGHANHKMFWSILAPAGSGGGGAPEGELADAINSSFGSFDGFKEQFSNAAATRFGSGWAWCGFDGPGKLHVGSTANQDSPIMIGHRPILGLDVWEHAYYLNYQNRRPDYISAFFNVINWSKVAANYEMWKGAGVQATGCGCSK